MKNEEIKKLYDYCKGQGYNESEEQFEEDLRQLVIEEIENNDLKNVVGGKMEVSKKITAGLLSLLSLGSGVNPISAYSKPGVSSGKSESKTVKSSSKLKKILLAGTGTAAVGVPSLLILGGCNWFYKQKHAGDIRSPEDAKKIFDENDLDDNEVISRIEGNTVHFYWKEGSEIRTNSRPKMSAKLVGTIFKELGVNDILQRTSAKLKELANKLGVNYTDIIQIAQSLIYLERAERFLSALLPFPLDLEEFIPNFKSLFREIKNATLMFPHLNDVFKVGLAYTRSKVSIKPNYKLSMKKFPNIKEWEEIFESVESKSADKVFDYIQSSLLQECSSMIGGWCLNSGNNFENIVYAMVFYPEFFEGINIDLDE